MTWVSVVTTGPCHWSTMHAKYYSLILLQRLKECVELYLSEEQAGFRSDRSTVQQILALMLIAEKALQKQDMPVYGCFINFQKAFDSVSQNMIWAVLQSYRVGTKLTRILKPIYVSAKAAIQNGSKISKWFKPEKATHQGDSLLPVIFITLLEMVQE